MVKPVSPSKQAGNIMVKDYTSATPAAAAKLGEYTVVKR